MRARRTLFARFAARRALKGEQSDDGGRIVRSQEVVRIELGGLQHLGRARVVVQAEAAPPVPSSGAGEVLAAVRR